MSRNEQNLSTKAVFASEARVEPWASLFEKKIRNRLGAALKELGVDADIDKIECRQSSCSIEVLADSSASEVLMGAYPMATLGDTVGIRAPTTEPDGRLRFHSVVLISADHHASASYDKWFEPNRKKVRDRVDRDRAEGD